MQDLSSTVKQLTDLLNQVKDEQSYIVVRERTHRNTAESTNGRVKWWSIFQLGVLIGEGIFQVWWLKRFFEVYGPQMLSPRSMAAKCMLILNPIITGQASSLRHYGNLARDLNRMLLFTSTSSILLAANLRSRTFQARATTSLFRSLLAFLLLISTTPSIEHAQGPSLRKLHHILSIVINTS